MEIRNFQISIFYDANLFLLNLKVELVLNQFPNFTVNIKKKYYSLQKLAILIWLWGKKLSWPLRVQCIIIRWSGIPRFRYRNNSRETFEKRKRTESFFKEVRDVRKCPPPPKSVFSQGEKSWKEYLKFKEKPFNRLATSFRDLWMAVKKNLKFSEEVLKHLLHLKQERQ